MDYMVQGQVDAETVEELEIILAAQSELSKNIVKHGEISRLVFPAEEGQEFTRERFRIIYRTAKAKDGRSFYHGFTAFLTQNNLNGWAAWHECRHTEINEPCSWNEEFNHEKTGGDL